MTPTEGESWDLEITGRRKFLDFGFKEVMQYRDLLWMFIVRDFKQFYKQTVLGPLWFVVQPMLTMLTYVFIFGRIAQLPSDGLPRPLFYLSGITAWGYFALCITRTSTVLRDNKNIFSKVYFPRIILPLSLVVSNLLRFVIQFLLLVGTIFYFVYMYDFDWQPTNYVWLIPYLVLLMALLGLSLGLIVTALTTVYRDLAMLITFSVQLLMWLTTVVYPLSYVPENLRPLFEVNPMTYIIEGMRVGLFGEGTFVMTNLYYTTGVALACFVFAIMAFNRVERNFVDTI